MPRKEITVEEWCQALESGKYGQIAGGLFNGNKSYCCLGVLCRIGGAKFHQIGHHTPTVYFSSLDGKSHNSYQTSGGLEQEARDSFNESLRRFKTSKEFTFDGRKISVYYDSTGKPKFKVKASGQYGQIASISSLELLFIHLNDTEQFDFKQIARVARKLMRPNAKIIVDTI